MKKLSIIILSCLSSLAFSMSPPQEKVLEPTQQEKLNPSIISSESFYISKNYDESNVPKDLKQWLPWVNKNNLFQYCVEQHCVFVPKLTLSQNNHYKFLMEGTSLVKNAWIPLPSSEKVWPLNVSVNGKKTIIIKHDDKPFVQVQNQDFKLEIEYSNSIFDKDSTFTLPFNIVSFNNLTNKNIILKDNVLSLNDISNQEVNNNFQEIKVYRKFTDSIPYFLHTKILINYSGKIKDLDLGTVLPENFKLSELNSDLKITFKNNHYYATINSGSHFINFSSFSNSPIDTISILGLVNESENEIWSIQKNNNIRNMDVSNVNIVDSQQVNVPQEWSKLPSYLVKDKLTINTSQQGISLNTNLKINAQRSTFFGFNDKVYSFDEINIDNNNSKELKFKNNIDLQSVSFEKPRMILKDGNNPYVLLNNQDKNGQIYFDSIFGDSIPSQLSDNYFVQNWNTFFTPRTELIWAKNATVSSPNFWFNSWNLYSLFSLSILIIAIYKMLGKETAFIALFSLISFYENNSVFWLLWLLLIISFAFNKYLPEKYTNFKNNFNYINLLGTSVAILFSFKFLFNEIFSILHPNLSQKVIFDIYYIFTCLFISFLIWKFINIFFMRRKNNLSKKFIFAFMIIFSFIIINHIFYKKEGVNSAGIASSSINIMERESKEIAVAAAPASMPPREIEEQSMEMADKSLEMKKEAKIIKRDLIQEKTQIGHELLQIHNMSQYTITPKNDAVDFIVAKPWLVNTYGLIQSLFLILLSYLLFIYNLILFKKGEFFNKLPLFLKNNYFVSKIQSKINEA